jgi:hypothetical protein
MIPMMGQQQEGQTVVSGQMPFLIPALEEATVKTSDKEALK